MSIRNPPSLQAIIGPGGRIDPNWERWLTDLARAVNGTTPGDTTAPEPVNFAINGSGSVTADGSVAGGEFVVGLDNDQDEPGTTKFYGTDSDGNRGFIALSEGLEAGTGIALTDSGYTMLPSVATTADLPLTGNAGEAVRVTDEAPGVYAWDGAAFTLDAAADGKAGVALAANLDDLLDVDVPSPGGGDVLGYDAVSGKWGALAGGGVVSLIGTYTVSGSAATTLNIPSIDLSASGTYLLEINAKNATASGGYVNLYFSGDTTATHYHNEMLTAAGTVGQTRTNNANLFFLYASATAHLSAEMVIDLDGKASVLSRSRENTSTSLVLRETVLVRLSAGNVTSIDITADIANALAVGSYAKLWRRA